MKKKSITRKGYKQMYLSKLLLIMKLTSILLIFGLINIYATGFSQARISIDKQNVSVKEVFETIENNSNYKFVYRDADFENVKVSITSKSSTVEEILTKILSATNNSYKLLDNNLVVIMPSANMQPGEITGTITDMDGSPLPGVNIIIKGTMKGAISDGAGNFSIQAELGEILQFSFIGYLSEEVEVTSQRVIEISLVPDIAQLDEVIVIGYGTQTKVTVTGSVSSTSGDDIKKSPSSNLTNSLAGRLPGVIIRQEKGELGYDDPTIRIRGVATWEDASPLVIIDGIEREGLGQLDPNDIESVTVLKDASAAIYGVRAANGVILVTTKRGKAGKPTFNFSYNHGIYQPTRIPEMMDAPTYAKVANEYAEWRGRSTMPFSDDDMAAIAADTSRRYANTDWVDEVIKPYSVQRRMNLTSSGGTENIKYFVSFGSLEQDPIFKNSIADYSQYNLRSNIDFTVNKYLSVSLDVAGRIEKRARDILGSTTTWVNTLNGIPTEHAVWPNGEYAPGRGFQSPLFLDKMGYYNREDRPIESRANFDFKVPFVEGLGMDGNFFADFGNRFSKRWTIPWEYTTWDEPTNTYTTEMTSTDIALEEYYRRTSAYTYNLRLKYKRAFNNHFIDAFVLWEQSESNRNDHTLERKNFATAGIDQLFAGGNDHALDWVKLTGVASEGARRNYLGRFNYDYAHKYMAQFQFRYDGSTRFPKEVRYGFFPGFSVGWRLSEETFMQNLSWLDNLKLRASYGQLGNDKILDENGNRLDFPYLTLYKYRSVNEQTGMSVFVFNTQDGLVGTKLIEKDIEPNLAITWETAEKYNVGFDASLLRGKLDVVAEFFFEKREDILTKRLSVPVTIGINEDKLPRENLGKSKNKGFEFVLTHKNNIGDLQYHISGNFAYARNEIVYWDEAEDTPEWQRKEGSVIGSNVWYLSDGIYNDTNEINASVHKQVSDIEDLLGTIKVKDVSGDTAITDADQVRIDQSYIPEITYGINFGLEYKGFDFSMLLQGQARAHYYQAMGPTQSHYILGAGENNLAFRAEDRWWYDNTDGTMPRVGDNTYAESDFYLFTGNFIRIKNLEFGYSLPSKILDRMSISKLRFYISGYNLYTFSKNKWIDPENDNRRNERNEDARGGEVYNYPINRVFNFGINLIF